MEFEQTLLDAGYEVYTYLHNCETARAKSEFIDARVVSLQNAYDATSELMMNGTNTYLEVLTAQESLLSSQLSQVENRFEMIQALINLYTALGGFGTAN